MFNASAKAPGHPSLNDLQEIGPSTQADLLELNLRFRMRRVAVTADIEKAFLQIKLSESDRGAVRFLWPQDPADRESPILHYRYTRVVFGVVSSTFLLGATLLHHLSKYDQHRSAVAALKNDRFVDDLVTGADNQGAATELAEEAVRICAEGGFPLRNF